MIIGSLMWAVTLGRFDVQYAVVTLTSYNTIPREGHLKAALRIVGYLKHHIKARVLIDPSPFKYPPGMELPKEMETWKNQYPDAEEEIPDNMPQPLMKPIQQTTIVNSSHTSNEVTKRSTVGIIDYMQNTPIGTYSKTLKIINSSSYGSEIMGARIATERTISNRYRLRMLGVPVETATIMLGDNRSAQISCSSPASPLNLSLIHI